MKPFLPWHQRHKPERPVGLKAKKRARRKVQRESKRANRS